MFSQCFNVATAASDMLARNFFFQVYVMNPKQDLHGLGYDPFKQAPEFRGMLLLK